MQALARSERAITRRIFRATWVRTAVYALAFAALCKATIAGYQRSFPTAADRARVVAEFGNNAALRLFYGMPHSIGNLAGYSAWRIGGFLSIFAALWAGFASARALRGEEEPGRWELTLAGAVRRGGAMAAALLGVAAGILLLWFGTLIGLVAAAVRTGDMTLGGALYLSMVVVAPAPVFAALGAVASGLVHRERTAKEIVGAALGISLLVRAIADTNQGLGWLRWASPLGWVDELRPFAGPRPAVLLLFVAATVALLAVAARLAVTQDVGDAVFRPRDTAKPRVRLLSSPTRLALRFERASLAGWVLGTGIFAMVMGGLAKTAAHLIASSPAITKELGSLGTNLTRPAGYLGLTFIFSVLVVAAFACTQLAAAREEEESGRLEILFPQPVGRVGWLVGRLIAALYGSALLTVAIGLFAWVGAAITHADVSLWSMVEAGLNCLPLAVLFLGLGTLLYGFRPRLAIAATYGILGVSFAWELFGGLLKAPGWALDLSAFHHVAPVPAQGFQVLSAAAMIAIGIVAGAGGVALFDRRDLEG